MWNGLRGLLRFRLRKLDANKQALVDLVGYVPMDWDLFECAFILKSMTRVSAQGVRLNNERLEYLGDAVLESVVSHYLYERYPTQSEGYLTASRSALVKRSTLNQVGKEMHLERWIKSDVNKLPDDAYGNVLESLRA